MLALSQKRAAQGQDRRVKGKGIKKGNPAKCLYCRKPIGKEDRWTKYTSRDNEYSIIVHAECNGEE